MPEPTPLRRVDMRNDFDCGVACLAMLTELAPEVIEERLGYQPECTRIPELPLGVLPEEAILILHQEGRCTLHVRTRAEIVEELDRYNEDSIFRHTLTTMPSRHLLPDHDGVLALIQGRRAMLAVKHRRGDFGHFIVWDDGQIFDPHPMRPLERDGLEDWDIRSAIVLMS